jgi:hypothetical protein
MAGNPYHDELGQFCSRDEMQAAILNLGTSGDLDGYFKLRNELEAIDKTSVVQKQLKDTVKGQPTQTSLDFAAALAKNDDYYEFSVEHGRRFDKVVQTAKSDTRGHQRSVHAFIDRETGDLIKAATWKAPQRNIKTGALAVRYNLATKEGFNEAIAAATSHGGYLYAK